MSPYKSPCKQHALDLDMDDMSPSSASGQSPAQGIRFIAEDPSQFSNVDMIASDQECNSKSAPLTECKKKDRRNAREQERRVMKWKVKEAMDSGGESEGEPQKKKKKGTRAKMAKKGTKKVVDDNWEIDDNDNEDPPKKFTVYFDIKGPKVTAASASQGQAPPPPLVIKHGLFFHQTNQSFASFKQSIAAATPCNPNMLLLNTLTWKFDTPTNAPKHPLPNEAGYETVLEAVQGKRGNSVIFLYMQPPKKDMSWSTGDPNQVEDPFNYDEEVAAQVLEGLLVKDQIFPVGNDPHFPSIHVYMEPHRPNDLTFTPWSWELNGLNLKVWGNAVAAGSTTLNMSPISSHFGDEKKLQAPQAQSMILNVQPQVPDYQLPYPGPPGFMPYMNPYGYPHYTPYPPPHQGFPPHHSPLMRYNYDLAAQPWHEPLILSPGVAVHLCVSLSDFCSHYGISATDEKKLRDVIEYQPGNKLVENLQEKTWGKGENGAQFGKLGWNTFLVAHRKFCEDVKEGVWAGDS